MSMMIVSIRDYSKTGFIWPVFIARPVSNVTFITPFPVPDHTRSRSPLTRHEGHSKGKIVPQILLNPPSLRVATSSLPDSSGRLAEKASASYATSSPGEASTVNDVTSPTSFSPSVASDILYQSDTGTYLYVPWNAPHLGSDVVPSSINSTVFDLMVGSHGSQDMPPSYHDNIWYY